MSASKHLLEVENLSVEIPGPRGAVRAVQRVSFTLDSGRTLALVGESGCGKSMLCRAVTGLLPRRAVLPGRPRVLFGGRDLLQIKEKELNRIRGREIGIVLQNPLSSLNPVLTIGAQIVEPMLLHLGLSRLKAKNRALDLLTDVGMPRPEEVYHCHPHQLSGGMRQRIAIAMALACDPALLIADEPTTALDVTVQAGILNLLGRLQAERGLALILVSHDLAVVAGRAHDTAVMYAGRIVEQAPTTSLFEHPRMWYSRGLLHSIPKIDAAPGARLAAIEGGPPDLAAPPSGCAFAPRCRNVQERCKTFEPPLVADPSHHSHLDACWFPCGDRAAAPSSPLPSHEDGVHDSGCAEAYRHAAFAEVEVG